MATRKKTASRGKAGGRKSAKSRTSRAKSGRWSSRVTHESHALDLEGGVFKKRSAHDIAVSLKRSAERSRSRKSSPKRSAISMLTFYINRAGKGLSASRKRTLEAAKDELRKLFA